MRTSLIVLAFVVSAVGGAVLVAANTSLGTWKLNEAKSTFDPGATKNTTVVYVSAGDSVKVTVDGVDGAESPSTQSGRGSSMANPIQSRAIRQPTPARIPRSTITRCRLSRRRARW